MFEGSLKIPKKQMPVTLWVHPEGQVVAALFLHLPGPDTARPEEPWDILNQPEVFLVVKRDDPDEMRFYNKASIIRVEYWDGSRDPSMDGNPIDCQLHMMDGSLLRGMISKALAPERSRLYDYMNDNNERFLKVHLGGGDVTLINKSYVAYISATEPVIAEPATETDGATPIELELAA
jgi:hypothetical protein